MSGYFFANSPGFGPLSWLMLLGWVIGLGVGVYLYGVWLERNPVRARFVRQLGLGLGVLSAAGLLLLALKALDVPYAGWRIWTYVVGLLTLLFAAWAGWFYLNRLPALLAAPGRQVGRPVRAARTYESNGPQSTAARSVPQPRPTPTTGRRESRRERKRKSR